MVKKISLFCCCCLILFALCSCSDNDCSCSDSCRECGESRDDEVVYTAKAILALHKRADVGEDLFGSDGASFTIDEELFDELKRLLDSEAVRNSVEEVFPKEEYRCYLQSVEDSNMIILVVSSTSKEDVADICSEMMQAFINASPSLEEDISFVVVEHPLVESPEE